MKHALLLLLICFGEFCEAQKFYTDWVQSNQTFFSRGHNLAHDDAGNIYSVGIFKGTVDLGTASSAALFSAVGKNDSYIRKVSNDGRLIWAKSIGNKWNDGFSQILVGDSANIFILGNFSDTIDLDPSAGSDMHYPTRQNCLSVIKLDSAGNYLWGKHVDGNVSSQGAVITRSGKIIISCYYQDTTDFDPGSGVSILRDTSAVLLWLSEGDGRFLELKSFASKTVGFTSISLDTSNNIWLAGHIDGSADMDIGAGTNFLSGKGAVLAKYSDTGSFITAGILEPEPATESNITIYDVCTDASNHLIAAGSFFGTVDLDPGAGIKKASAVVAACILKTDSLGNLIWAQTMSGARMGTDYAAAQYVICDEQSNIILNGQYAGRISIADGVKTDTIASAGLNDLFVLKLTPAGKIDWIKSVGGNQNEFAAGIITDGKGNIVQSGIFQDVALFDPAGVFFLNTSFVGGEYFLHKLKSVPLTAEEITPSEATFSIYPNPSNGIFYISPVQTIQTATVKVFDLLGRTVFEQSADFRRGSGAINLSGRTGMFIVEVNSGSAVLFREKVLIE